jgi:hypothetical protein
MCKLVVYTGLVLLVSACAGNPQAQSSASTTQGKMVCPEQAMGYHIQPHNCLTPEEIDARKKAADQAAQKPQPPR